ncbi:MAG: methyltransferase domain-containing protein [Candidatus Binataceae bacterium]
MKSASWKTCAAASALVLALSISQAAKAQEHVESAHHGFHDISHWARVFESPERAKWQKPGEVVRVLDLKPGQTVVDIGAGTGYFTRRFAAAVAPSGEAIGLDVEPAMVAYMKADATKLGAKNYEARLVKPDDPGLAPRSVDVVFFCDTLHHLENRVAYLRRLAGALKPGGRVVAVDLKKKTLPVGPPPADKISREEMIGEFRAAGYRLVREHHFLPYQYFLEFETRGAS